MYKTLTFFLLAALPAFAFSQEADTTLGWKNEVVGNLTLSQASFNNWEQGGENSLAWQVKLETTFERVTQKWNWVNKGKFELGFAKISDDDARKSADVIDLESVLSRKLKKLLNPYISISAKTQFVSGFEFNEEAKTEISKFFDPGYFTQSVGVGYKPNDSFRLRAGFALKETITNKFNQFAGGDKTLIEPGLTYIANFKQKWGDNILYKTKLDLFSNLKSIDSVDLLWENNVTMKVTKHINVNITFDVLYDKSISDKMQIKEVLGIGLTYTLL